MVLPEPNRKYKKSSDYQTTWDQKKLSYLYQTNTFNLWLNGLTKQKVRFCHMCGGYQISCRHVRNEGKLLGVALRVSYVWNIFSSSLKNPVIRVNRDKLSVYFWGNERKYFTDISGLNDTWNVLWRYLI